MVKAAINPKILNWAISNAHYTIEEFSKTVNVNIENVNKWIIGDDFPTYKQLEKISYKILKVPIAIFFFPEPPKEKITQSFRSLPNFVLDNLSHDFIKILRKAAAIQIKISELYDGEKQLSKFILDDLKIDIDVSALDLANILREYFQVSIEEQIGIDNQDLAFKYWRNLIEEHGVFVFKDAFHDNEISGFSLYDEKFPIIFINNSQSKSRQIFTLFHELAHLIFKTAGIDVLNDSYVHELSGTNYQIEVLCNKLAGCFLVPDDYFDVYLNGKNIDETFILESSKHFNVSREVILRKLLERKYYTYELYEVLANKWNQEFFLSKKEKVSTGGNYYLTQIQYLGEKYLDKVFSHYYQKKIGLLELSDYTGIKMSNISVLETTWQRN